MVAMHRSNNTAIIFDDTAYSYAALDDLSNQFGNLYLSLGLPPQSRVSFMLSNDILLIAAYFGAFKAGQVANPMGTRLTAEEVAYILDHAGSELLITSDEHAAVVADALALLKNPPKVLGIDAINDGTLQTKLKALPFHLLRQQSVDAPNIPAPAPDDGALLLYTSGTTGKPKGVMLTHRNVSTAIAAVKAGFSLTPADRTLCVMPLSHTNALMFSTLSYLHAGASTVICRRFSASEHWKLCKKYQVNSFSASPTILAILLETAPCMADEGAGLKFVKVASAPTSFDLAERFEARFGNGLLLETYGLTETTAINVMNPMAGPRKRGSIGKALPPNIVKIVDSKGVDLPPDAVGEIVIRAPVVMKEYFRDPEATERALQDGWMHSGDLAKMDEDGFIFIVGRKKEMIIRGGENISPLEVERVIARHPAVREAAAFGLADPLWGEIVAACVTPHEALNEPLREADIIEFCKGYLASFKVPQRITFVDELPRNGVGKIKRHELHRYFQERHAK
ncbi:MAG: AMP-dependent synthetase [Candidimonas sp.]|nr:MAG: AMP-dependent synthetase [Candidimonas sp.]TAM24887.1 MAG: AMP-dependent synthetase [Candidimonas sp.]TAM74612.1 MAG: AMP-dependent synthetase [Candidimonas sp.]